MVLPIIIYKNKKLWSILKKFSFLEHLNVFKNLIFLPNLGKWICLKVFVFSQNVNDEIGRKKTDWVWAPIQEYCKDIDFLNNKI